MLQPLLRRPSSHACRITAAAEASTTRRRSRPRVPAAASARSASTVDRRSSCISTGTSTTASSAAANDSACAALSPRSPRSESGRPIDDQGRAALARRARRSPSARPAADRRGRCRQAPRHDAPDRRPPRRSARRRGRARGRGRGRGPATRSSTRHARPRSSRARAGIPPSACEIAAASRPPAMARMSFPPAPPPMTVAASRRSSGAVTPRADRFGRGRRDQLRLAVAAPAEHDRGRSPLQAVADLLGELAEAARVLARYLGHDESQPVDVLRASRRATRSIASRSPFCSFPSSLRRRLFSSITLRACSIADRDRCCRARRPGRAAARVRR